MYRIYAFQQPMKVAVWRDTDTGSERFGWYESVQDAIAALPAGAEWIVI